MIFQKQRMICVSGNSQREHTVTIIERGLDGLLSDTVESTSKHVCFELMTT